MAGRWIFVIAFALVGTAWRRRHREPRELLELAPHRKR